MEKFDDWYDKAYNGYVGKNYDAVKKAFKAGQLLGPDMEYDRLSKKEMWEEIQKIRTLVGSDGTQTICEDIESYAERMAELS